MRSPPLTIEVWLQREFLLLLKFLCSKRRSLQRWQRRADGCRLRLPQRTDLAQRLRAITGWGGQCGRSSAPAEQDQARRNGKLNAKVCGADCAVGAARSSGEEPTARDRDFVNMMAHLSFDDGSQSPSSEAGAEQSQQPRSKTNSIGASTMIMMQMIEHQKILRYLPQGVCLSGR